MLSLALGAGKIVRKKVPVREEHNVRQRFFEREQFAPVMLKLPSDSGRG